MSGTLELYSDVSSAGLNTVLIDPINPTSGQTYTLELFEVQVSFVATASTDNNVVTGLKAAIEASADEEWANVTATVVNDAGNADAAGDRLLLTYSTSTGITRLWRGDATAVAQVVTVTPGVVSDGDAFTLTINGKEITYTATASTADNVVDGMIAAISASTAPEFSDFTTENTGGVLTLTASTAGVPFTVTAGAESGDGSVTVAQTQAAAAGTQQSYTFILPNSDTIFRLRYNGEETTQQTTATVTEGNLETALDSLSGVANSDVTIVTNPTHRVFTVAFDADDEDAEFLTVVAYSLALSAVEDTAGSAGVTAEVQTLSIGKATGDAATIAITVDGHTTEAIEVGTDIASATREANIITALQALPIFDAGDVATVTFSTGALVSDPDTYEITFGVDVGNVPLITAEWVTEPAVDIAEVTTVTKGNAALNSIYSVTIDADAGTFTLTIDGDETGNIAFDATIGTVETAVEAVSSVDAATVTGSAGNYTIEFAGSQAATAVTLTGDGASLTGSGTESFTVATTVDSAGPNHWDTASNWIPSGVPEDGDAVRFEFGSIDCLYGLDQSGVLLSDLQFSQGYTGKVGLPRINSSGGFFEYRTRDLTIGATTITVGHGEGSGSGKIQINTGSDRATVKVRGTGGGVESGVPAFTWRGLHSLNSVEVWGGEFGTALFSDQTSRIGTFTQRGGVASLANCTLTTVDAPRQTLSLHNCNLGGYSVEL